MTGINHKQAQRYLRAAADGLLRENQRTLLDAHLRDCDSCRAEADELNALEARVKKNFQARWDASDGPSRNVMTTIQSRSRRSIMTNRINTGLKMLAGIAALLVLGLIFSSVIQQLQKSSTNISAPISTTQQAIGTDKFNGGLLAFVSEKSGDPEIYTMYADGSELTNLTNNPAQDMNPVWSPDGKRIAFESDRDGFMQIFLMDADGSNVIQLTDDEVDHTIGGNGLYDQYDSSLNFWSPNGSKLIFSKKSPGDEKGMLYIMDINGENKKPLIEETGIYYYPSWSPDGKHIAFIVDENSVARIYSTDADGNNLTNVTKTLPADETLDPWNYSWSRDAQSISFIASNWNQLLGGSFGGGEGGPNSKWMAYESSLDGNTLVTNATTRSPIGGYWQGTYFLSGSSMMSSSPAFTWVQPKGKTTMVNPLKDCQKLLDSNTGGYATGYSSYKQSSNGNVVIGGYCPNGDKWLFWVNSNGTVKPLLNSPIHVEGNTTNAMDLWAPAGFIWSPDDKYIAFTIFSLGKTDMYIVDVNESLKDPSIQPFQMAIGNGDLYYSPSWQPKLLKKESIVIKATEEKPTSEPPIFTLNIKEAETQSGFDVLEPSYLPEGYTFQGADYNSQTVTLTYASPLVDPFGQGTIHIFQKNGDFPKEPDLPSHATPVSIGDVMGEFTRGAWIYESGATTPRWDGSADYYALSWKKDGISFMVDFIGGEGIPNINLEGLRAIAESMKSVPTAQQFPPIGTDKSNGEWIAFIGGKTVPWPDSTALDITQDVYMVHPNGTGFMNLTNNEVHTGYLFANLQWSPDGKNLIFLRTQGDKYDFIRTNPGGNGYSTIARPITDPDNHGYSWSPNSMQIAFADSSSGNYDIYTVYADGRNDPQLRQLTNDPAQDVGFVWSPDGSQIAFERLDGEKLSVYIMNADGSNQREVAKGAGKVNLRWSLDGISIYASSKNNSWLDCETCIHKPGIYRIYLNVVQVHQVYAEQDASKVQAWYLYDTPQNSLYFARIDQSAFLNFQGNWSYADGSSIREIGTMDTHQTCMTTTGNILGEHISPNERFSVITDACAGGFDLYLADREATTPEKQITHLLRLPLSTRFSGEGGDGAYLPIFWSPDGRTIMYKGNSGYGPVIYLLDVEKLMEDPATKLIPLTEAPTEFSNSFDTIQWLGEIQWQPQP